MLHNKAKGVASKENTLNHWAGYDITPEDMAKFKVKLNDLKTVLVKEVGQHSPIKVGDAELYDLGGNVAEYSADGSVYGFSAYDYIDKHLDSKNSNKRYVGFRVVKD